MIYNQSELRQAIDRLLQNHTTGFGSPAPLPEAGMHLLYDGVSAGIGQQISLFRLSLNQQYTNERV